MPVDWPIFIGQAAITAVLASGLTLLGQRYLAGYQHHKDIERDRLQEQLVREREQWSDLRSRISLLLRTAGALVTHVEEVAALLRADEINVLLRELDTYPGQFAEYPDVQRAIYELHNTVGDALGDDWLVNTAPDYIPWEEREAWLAVFLTDEEREQRAHETPEEREQRQSDEAFQQAQVRQMELPQSYQALVAAAVALLASPAPFPNPANLVRKIMPVQAAPFREGFLSGAGARTRTWLHPSGFLKVGKGKER